MRIVIRAKAFFEWKRAGAGLQTKRIVKKFIVSFGLVAAGAASVHAAYAPDAGDTSKYWSLSSSLRGFYDDNYTTTPQKQGSWGFQINPSLGINLPFQQTEFGMRYSYGLYWYENRERLGQDPIDQTHQVDLWLDHAFSPRWETRFQDTLVVAQEPNLLAQQGPVSVAQRVSGNNIANTAMLSLHTDWTREFSTLLAYHNAFYDYENSGATILNATGTPATLLSPGPPPIYLYPSGSPASVSPSYAGTLNRVEQAISLDFQWQVMPTTMAFIGYQFGLVNYVGDELIGYSQPFPFTSTPTPLYSDSRDNLSHFLYVGVQHEFTTALVGSLKAGFQYTDYFNDPSGNNNSVSPYGDASLIYTYASGCYAQVGVTESQNATDTVSPSYSSGQITLNQQSTVVYGSVTHRLAPKLTGEMVGHFQYSTYNEGQYNDQATYFYNWYAGLTYSFTRHFSSDLRYNFDYYTSDIPGSSYTRNRVSLGVTATF